MIWYKENTEQLYENLQTSEQGLSSAEVTKRLKEYGENKLAIKKDSIWKIILEPFKNVFVAVLVIAALVSGLSGHVLDAIIIAVIITVNSGIFYSQQYATSRVLRSLKKHSIQQVTVVRNGLPTTVSSLFLVPGDIIELSEGERIPADARIVHTDSLQIDESSLTGESVPVQKKSGRTRRTISGARRLQISSEWLPISGRKWWAYRSKTGRPFCQPDIILPELSGLMKVQGIL